MEPPPAQWPSTCNIHDFHSPINVVAPKLLDIQNSRLTNCTHGIWQAIQVETNAGGHDIYPTTIKAYLRLCSTNMPNPCLHVH